jgi:adenylyltransferase/sulfurtransferase
VVKAGTIPVFNEFYSRQMVLKELGRKGQRKLAESNVAIVGLGGLGTISSLYLALAGVGHLRLIDQDIVELRNLHRQILYSPKDVNYPKVEVASKSLRKHNPLVEVEPVPENLHASNAKKLLAGMDCVVDGLDNMQTRYLVNRACTKLRIPYVFGAAVGIEGNVSVFAPLETPCLECVFPSVDDSKLLTCDVRGVLGAAPGVIGAIQAIETVKVLTGMGAPLKGKLLICDFNDMYFATIDVFKRGNCEACGDSTTVRAGKEKLVWLCGRDTVNINPEKPWQRNFNDVCRLVRKRFRVHVKSRLAIMFAYKGFEVTLFNGGRMLIKNVKDEKSALRTYKEIMDKLGAG